MEIRLFPVFIGGKIYKQTPVPGVKQWFNKVDGFNNYKLHNIITQFANKNNKVSSHDMDITICKSLQSFYHYAGIFLDTLNLIYNSLKVQLLKIQINKYKS